MTTAAESLPPTKVLIVDDLAENLLALEALIRLEGCTIYQATSGEEALALLLDHDFALAVLDVQMPLMNGFELAELMRGTEKTRHVPIVFVTAAGREPAYAFRGYESGAVDFLYKPLDAFAVLGKVSVFIDLYRQRQRVREQLAALEEGRRQQQLLLEQLQRTQGDLQAALRARDEFMSLVAHELRTPLGVLSLDAQMREAQLGKGNLAYFGPDALQRMVAKDLRQVRSMTRLIEDMLDVSRIRSGMLSVQPELTDLSRLVDQLVNDFIESHGADRHITRSVEPGVIGIWDAFRIEQVVVNLLMNALRHGGGQPIHVGLRQLDGAAELVVRDGGGGVALADQARIFEPFVRIAGPTSARGLGLGLYVSRQLVEAHGGRIAVDSRPGEGAAFSVTLPLQPRAPAPQ